MQDAGEVCVFSVSVGSEKHILTSQAEWVKTDPTYRLQSPEEEAITRVDSNSSRKKSGTFDTNKVPRQCTILSLRKRQSAILVLACLVQLLPRSLLY